MECVQRIVPRAALKIIVFMFALLLSGCNNSEQASPATPIAQNNTATATVAKPATPPGSGFDFYVLALSWSPHYCAAKGKNADRQQCDVSKPFGFIVHGLWPQNENGYPSGCFTDDEPTREEIRSLSDLTPSASLVRHEWRKHGACSGLSPKDYFAAIRSAARAVIIPPQYASRQKMFSQSANQIENSFVRANAALDIGAIAVVCDRQTLSEVRICLTKSMQFRACVEVDRAGCRAQTITTEPMK